MESDDFLGMLITTVLLALVGACLMLHIVNSKRVNVLITNQQVIVKSLKELHNTQIMFIKTLDGELEDR